MSKPFQLDTERIEKELTVIFQAALQLRALYCEMGLEDGEAENLASVMLAPAIQLINIQRASLYEDEMEGLQLDDPAVLEALKEELPYLTTLTDQLMEMYPRVCKEGIDSLPKEIDVIVDFIKTMYSR